MTDTTKSFRAKTTAAALAFAITGSSILGLVAPTTAYANDGLAANASYAAAAKKAAHYEGEAVTINTNYNQPVYAEWHRGSSGKWWAMFWTNNGTKIYAEPAASGSGWVFHAYDKKGNFVNVVRCEESSTHGLYGPKGVSSHWRSADGSIWF